MVLRSSLLALAASSVLLVAPMAGAQVLHPQQVFIPADGAQFDGFALGVALDGDMLAIGSPGHAHLGAPNGGSVYLYRLESGGWTFLKELHAPAPQADARFGEALALSDGVLAVGARFDDQAAPDAGAVYVFGRDTGGADAWGLLASLTASDSEDGDLLGTSVGLVGSTLVAGAPQWDAPRLSNTGAAYVFERHTGGVDAWGEVARLEPADPATHDRFGSAVATNGGSVAVGAPQDDDAGFSSGSVYVFEHDGSGPGAWGQVQKLTASDAEADDRLGSSVAMGDDLIVAGAYFEDEGGTGAGAAYSFEPGVSGWQETSKLRASDAQSGARFGWAVAAGGEAIVVTAPGQDVFGPGSTGSSGTWGSAGQGYLFTRDASAPGGWSESARLQRTPLAAGNQVGATAVASGNRALLGALSLGNSPSPDTDPGGALVFELFALDAVPLLSHTGLAVLALSIALAGRAALRRR